MWEIIQEQLKDLIKEREDKVYQILLSKWIDKKYPNLKIKYIQDDVFVIWNDKWVYSYCTEKWEPIFNIRVIRWFNFVKTWEAIIGSWYLEKKEWEGYKLYELIWFDWNDNPVTNKKPINPYSKEYYKAWVDIDFNATILDKTLLKKSINYFSKDELLKLQKSLLSDINTWAILIDDMEILLEQKKISKEFFMEAISKIVSGKLILQCWDKRLDDVNQWITEEKLKIFYQKWYIDQNLAKECYNIIKRKQKKEEKKLEIKQNTSSNLANYHNQAEFIA